MIQLLQYLSEGNASFRVVPPVEGQIGSVRWSEFMVNGHVFRFSPDGQSLSWSSPESLLESLKERIKANV